MPPDRSHKEASEEKERPLATSCTACRVRKIKCCSSKPICANCTKNGSECEYRVRQKPGLKQGVGGELLKRVDILEEQMAAQALQLSEVMRRLEGAVGASAPTGGPSGFVPTTGLTPGSISATSFGEGSSSLQNLGPSAQSQVSALGAAEDLPPHDLLMSLIEIFFHHVHPFAPFLRREQLQPRLTAGETIYQWPIQLYAVVACSLRFSHDDRWATLPPKEHYHQLAKDKVVLQSMRSTSVDSLEALVLIALDDVGGTTSPTSWGSLALATRTTGNVGFHQEQSGTSSPAAYVNAIKLLAKAASPADDEERRRLFWTTFVLDRWSASSTGWDFAFADETIHRRLPCDEGDWHQGNITETPYFRSSIAMDSPYDLAAPLDRGFTALLQTADLLGCVHQLHRKPLATTAFIESSKALESALTHWYNKISPAFVNFGSSPLVLLVQALHFATQIKLMSLLAYPLRPDMTPDPRAADKAHEAALSIANIARLVTLHSPYGSWAYFVAARMLILRAHRNKETIAPVVEDLVKGLESASVYFDMAKRYHSLISRALRRVHDDGKSTAISVLVDLRHTSFGVSADSAALPSGQVTPNGGSAVPPLDLSGLWAMDMDYQTLSTGWFDEQGTGDQGLFDTWLLSTNA